jgi:hypothetical protein
MKKQKHVEPSTRDPEVEKEGRGEIMKPSTTEEADAMLERARRDLLREFIEVLNADTMDGPYYGRRHNFEATLLHFNVAAETYHAVKKAATRFHVLDFRPLKFRINEKGDLEPIEEEKRHPSE